MKSHLLKMPYSRYCTIYSLEMVPEEIIALVSYILFRNSKHENSFGLFWLLIYADQASEPVTLKQWDILGRKYHFMQFFAKKITFTVKRNKRLQAPWNINIQGAEVMISEKTSLLGPFIKTMFTFYFQHTAGSERM